MAVDDSLRITKNFRVGTSRFRNNELCTAIDGESITVGGGKMIKRSGPLHLDQGVAVTSHASQGKTVDQVIVSVPVAAFSQTNEAQFYVSMSRARHAMQSLYRLESSAKRGGDEAERASFSIRATRRN